MDTNYTINVLTNMQQELLEQSDEYAALGLAIRAITSRELVEQWRDEARAAYGTAGYAFDRCADELESALGGQP